MYRAKIQDVSRQDTFRKGGERLISEKGKKMLSQNIKHYRKEAGLTQDDLGKKIGMSGVAIMRYEKNQRVPKLETIDKIAEALNINGFNLLGSEYWELKFPDTSRKATECERFTDYMNSLGFIINDLYSPAKIPLEYIPEPFKSELLPEELEQGFQEGETHQIEIVKAGQKIILEENEFNNIQSAVKELIEFKLWKYSQKQT